MKAAKTCAQKWYSEKMKGKEETFVRNVAEQKT